MNSALRKAQAKKKKFLKRKKEIIEEDDSDQSISSDDEEEVSENMVGKLIQDKYLILKYLSRGSFSKVWLVLDIKDANYYALKIQDSEYNEDMEQEVKIYNYLQRKLGKYENVNQTHPIGFLVDSFVIKVGQEKCQCMLMELLGISIFSLTECQNNPQYKTSTIRKVIHDIVSALNYYHHLGIIHTDLKPDNILLTEYDENIKKYLEKINQLGIEQVFEEVFQNYIPQEISMLDKNKRKMIKRKIKIKTMKEISKRFYPQILEINKNDFHQNVDLKIEELDDNLDIESDDNISENTSLDIDWEGLRVKLIDFGNAEFVGNNNQENIYIRPYRPPENIIDDEVTTKSDIWFVGCFLYELLTGEVLFDIESVDNQKFEKDRIHLLEMYSILGKMPREMTMNCEYSEDLFDMKGRILKHKGFQERDLREELGSLMEISEDELDLIEDLIFKILEYDPIQRLSAKQILNHKWFQYEYH